jgi:hypothetical protein
MASGFAGSNCDFWRRALDRIRRYGDQRWGCLSLVCTVDGRRSPFVFLPRRKRRIIPYVTLFFCKSIKDLTRRAGPIGRALLRRGFPIAAIDANGPVPGLQGWFMQGKHKYFRGPRPPRFGAYSELVIVGGNVPIAAGAAN